MIQHGEQRSEGPPWLLLSGFAVILTRLCCASGHEDRAIPIRPGVFWRWPGFMTAARARMRRGSAASGCRSRAIGCCGSTPGVPDGLVNGKAPGTPSLRSDPRRQALRQAVEDGPVPAVHGVARWRLIDLAQWLFDELRVSISKQTVSRELRNMGFRKLSARPRRHAQDEEAAAAFKTYGPPRLQAILRSGLVSLPQRIRSQDQRPGQDGDRRVPVLISFSGSNAIF